MTSQPKPKLIYIGDPMCSWCYGFAPEVSEVANTLKDEVEVEIIMGGLRPYNTQTMTELKDFLTDHWQHVNEASKQEFNYGILENATIPYDTEPPCRAVVTVRKMNPEKAVPFFKLLQTNFYKDNKNMNHVESYQEAVESVGLDYEAFKKSFLSEEMKAAVRKDFERSAELGIRGFPSLILQQGEQFSLISNGYRKANAVIEIVREQLKK